MRADERMVALGLVDSRNRAKAEILAGRVQLGTARITKPSENVPPDAQLSLDSPENPWVSRAGLKLDHALTHFRFDVRGLALLDLGASTGGFTQVLLARGAQRVYAVDVGQDQLHPRLQEDARVVSLESTDARQLDERVIPEKIDALVADVSFISLTQALGAPLKLLAPKAWLVLLIKPQFECGPGAHKKGIVKQDAMRAAAARSVSEYLRRQGEWEILPVIDSPVMGGKGNRELLLGAARG